ncbi:MAG: TonB family protein [Candidatus Sulfotelmatobacter sp.]
MGYQALLFCPDEKTARTVTQVLSELEFNVESCTEPFAAVKKLMSQHFDAVVVDCDNEQNATLLFKSARNSTSNQASLAVAVVEGQAGVAKAFRIGANLVLTKPINIEQAKGTLRVARGLLRKSEPAKPGAPVTTASPATPVAAKPAPPAKPEAKAAPAGISTTSAWTNSDARSAWPAPAAAASSHAAAQDEDLLEISGEVSVAAPSAAAPVTPANKFITPAPQADKFLAGAVASPGPDVKAPSNPGLPATLGRGAASAPAPARERQDTRAAEASPERSAEADARQKKAEVVPSDSSSLVGSAPTFTFGGANVPAVSSGAGKKVFLGIATAAIIAVAAYAGWTHFHGRASEPESTQTGTISAPVTPPQNPKPSGAKPSPVPAVPTTSTALPSSQTTPLSAKGHASDSTDSASHDADLSSAPSSTKPSSSASSAMSKTGDAAEDTAAPLVVKGGKAPTVHAKPGAADAAPSMIGIADAGAGAPPPDLGSGGEVIPKPLLQTMNVSQGVSRGLLFKKVQPIYPRNALEMRVEGSVELMATISKTGDITHVKVLSGNSQLSRAATDAVKQWKYKPYLLNGEPVEIQTQVTINFKLPK